MLDSIATQLVHSYFHIFIWFCAIKRCNGISAKPAKQKRKKNQKKNIQKKTSVVLVSLLFLSRPGGEGERETGRGTEREWPVSSWDLFNDISIAVSIAKASHKLTAVRAGKFDWKSGETKQKETEKEKLKV